jgi:hypothetical protein
MPRLPSIECPFCGCEIHSRDYQSDRPPNGTTYGACLRQCPGCEVGFSNANTGDPSELAIIQVDPLKGLPAEIVDGFLETLANAINLVNRRSKQQKLNSSNSEDHATWTIFRFLQVNGLLREVLANAGIGPALAAQAEPAVLFWGVPVPANDANDPRAQSTQRDLMAALTRLREAPKAMSEPDVILDFGHHGLVVFEAKLRSINDSDDKKVPEGGWDRYVNAHKSFRDEAAARGTGLYQLAGGRPLTLVNLAPRRFFQGPMSKTLDDFERALATGPTSSFCRLGWSQLLATGRDLPEWLIEYDRVRGVSSGSARVRRDLVSSISSPISRGDIYKSLTRAHDYLALQGRRALEEAGRRIQPDGRWGTAVKREHVQLPDQGKPTLIPRSVKTHSLGEVVNQCATLERLLDFLRWSAESGSEFSSYRVERCHPSTSSDKPNAAELDNDLVLESQSGERAYFEISDVASESDGNRKLQKDLASLRVLAEDARGRFLPAEHWPEGRVFVIVSAEFAGGLLRRKHSWVEAGHGHFAESVPIGADTVLIEIRAGRNS